ncbi:MAG: PqqD family peptide modification chaperone [Bacteroidaceae bacterium]|nr:PqqD family peptide modification chaperone [Bacteroidaceae bacterium]
MLVKQSKNTFIRTTDHYGYVTNQLTRHDRTYDESGADWLKEINREPQEIDDIVARLVTLYEDADPEIIKCDFIEFIESLAKDKFIVTGETAEELDAKDEDFTYSVEIPKTMADSFYQATDEKVSENTQDFFLEEVQGRPLISSLQFELSSRCNERCIHCYIPNEKKNHGFDMPTAKVKSILDEFAAMGGIHVTLSGGEAFLHKDIIEIARYCREKDLKISILSNLISLKDEQIEALKDVNLSLIQVSLYSMNPEIHDFITTVKGSFEKTKSSIEKLVEANIPIQISCPIMKANRIGYEKVLEYAQRLKVKAQTDYIMMARSDLDTENLANRLSLEETEELLRSIIEHDVRYREETLQQLPITDEIKFNLERYMKQPVCGVGYDNCCITANGDVYPCAGWQDYVLGNVYKQTLKEIWENSERVKELRKITQASFPQCLECEARDYCARCLVRNYNESGGDMFAVNHHFCDVAFLNKKIVEEYRAKGLI